MSQKKGRRGVSKTEWLETGLQAMSEGGGYVTSPAHTVRQEVPFENVLAYLEAAQEYAG